MLVVVSTLFEFQANFWFSKSVPIQAVFLSVTCRFLLSKYELCFLPCWFIESDELLWKFLRLPESIFQYAPVLAASFYNYRVSSQLLVSKSVPIQVDSLSVTWQFLLGNYGLHFSPCLSIEEDELLWKFSIAWNSTSWKIMPE